MLLDDNIVESNSALTVMGDDLKAKGCDITEDTSTLKEIYK